MTHGNRTTPPLGALLFAGVLLFTLPGIVSADEETGWRLRFYAASLDFDVEATAGSSLNYESGVGGGIGFNAEYQFSRRLGVDLGILGAGGVDVRTSVQGPGGATQFETDTLGYSPLTAGLNVHLTPGERVDVFVSPFAAWIRYGSVSVRSGTGFTSTSVEADNDLAPGATLGVGVPFGQRRRWSVVASLTYIDSSVEGSADTGGARLSSDHDTTILGLGFGFRL